MKNIFDTKNVSFLELLGNGRFYKIPEFQRDFSWEEEHWEDLWNDMIDLDEEIEHYHYMGTIVLQSTDKKKEYIIVDGQQRITTLSLFILSIIKMLKGLIEQGVEIENNKERINKITELYIGEKSLSDLFYRSKLTLNDNNNSFYQSKLLELKKPNNIVKLRDSEKLLYKSFIYYFDKIKEKFSNDDGSRIGAFLEKISDSLLFIQITVDDDLSAYTVFETLNARGVELTTTDLLKNYLFSIAASSGKAGSEFKILKENWQQIVDIVNLKKFPLFLRFYLNSKREIVRKERLFKEIKKEIKNLSDVMNLIDDLKETAYLYSAILNPYDDFWNEHSDQKEIRKSLLELKLFGVTQPIPLLFALYKNKIEWFGKILKLVVNLSFRYNVIGKLNPNILEKVYNKIARKIYNNEITSIQQIKDLLKDAYIDDNVFVDLFKAKIVSTSKNRRLVKYILTKIENQISNSDFDFNDSNFTIEHILPENYTEEWNELFSNETEKYVYRLGNYTLLEVKKNKEASNKLFNEKMKIYQTSKFKLTNTELNYDEWNISNVNHFQNKLAKFSKSIWKI